MEDIVGSGKPKLQRYPLRSGTKLKEEKPPVPELSNPSSTSVSKPRYNLLVLFLQMFGIGGFDDCFKYVVTWGYVIFFENLLKILVLFARYG